MQLGRLTVSNYRAIQNAAVDFDDVTILIGENNAGKSAFLAALDLFFASSPRVLPTDYYGGDTSIPIAVTIEFVGLTPAERDQFSNNLVDDRLIVTRTFHPDLGKGHGGYSVDRLVHPDFSACRAEEGARAKREIYDALRERFGLPAVTRAEDVEAELDRWEEANPSTYHGSGCLDSEVSRT
ncbi:MAG TPA: AAA family ATPase [Vitreimonas sp.]|uniref:ATP-dependent nuclease n=1 Tax=Vitreimonas sp. TaxID=3069702 RepID=UPI002D3118D8|nr:AAA family ATPase [Vitreimonas sp.]HYD87694.1 AAA family ATPase [Vitreimonas sp.]